MEQRPNVYLPLSLAEQIDAAKRAGHRSDTPMALASCLWVSRILRTVQETAIFAAVKRQAEELLIEWAAVTRSQDERVRTAVASGVTKSEVYRLTGIARSTIDAILGAGADGPDTARQEAGRS